MSLRKSIKPPALRLAMLQEDREDCIEACCNLMVSAKEKKRLKALTAKLEKEIDKVSEELWGKRNY